MGGEIGFYECPVFLIANELFCKAISQNRERDLHLSNITKHVNNSNVAGVKCINPRKAKI